MLLSYFIGLFWLIFLEVNAQYLIDIGDTRDANESFYFSYELEKNQDYENVILVFYYALTTLSSVGFGDYSPQNTDERIVIIGVLFI